MEHEVLSAGDRVHHAGYGFGTIERVILEQVYAVVWDEGPDRFSMVPRGDLLRLPPARAAEGSSVERWDKVAAEWRLVRQIIEHTLEGRPNGFDPQHLAALRLREVRVWRALENLAAVAAISQEQ